MPCWDPILKGIPSLGILVMVVERIVSYTSKGSRSDVQEEAQRMICVIYIFIKTFNVPLCPTDGVIVTLEESLLSGQRCFVTSQR